MNDNYIPLNVVAVFAHPDDEAGAVGTLMNHSDRRRLMSKNLANLTEETRRKKDF